jgi:hypothetical protein
MLCEKRNRMRSTPLLTLRTTPAHKGSNKNTRKQKKISAGTLFVHL